LNDGIQRGRDHEHHAKFTPQFHEVLGFADDRVPNRDEIEEKRERGGSGVHNSTVAVQAKRA